MTRRTAKSPAARMRLELEEYTPGYKRARELSRAPQRPGTALDHSLQRMRCRFGFCENFKGAGKLPAPFCKLDFDYWTMKLTDSSPCLSWPKT